MAVIPLTTPYSMKSSILTIDADDFTAAVTGAQFNPSVTPTVTRFIGGAVYKDQTIADWTLALGHAQDLANGSLTRYLLANQGSTKACTLTPVAGGPTVSATIIIGPGPLGGVADGNLAQGSIELPVNGTPTLSSATPTVPTIVSALPSGAAAGAVVTIRGTGFLGTIPTTGVKFGATNATTWSVVDNSTIVAVVPAGAAGSAPVTVTNATGVSSAFAYTRA